MYTDQDERVNWNYAVLTDTLRRTSVYRPDEWEIELIESIHPRKLVFPSAAEARAAVLKYHERHELEERLASLSRAVEDEALDGFERLHMQANSDDEKRTFRRNVRVLALEGNFDSLAAYSRDISTLGYGTAKKNLAHVDKGWRYRFHLTAAWAVIETALIFLVISKAEHGFQTVVVCALAMLYCFVSHLTFALLSKSDAQHAYVVNQLERLRLIASDRTLDWSIREYSQKGIASSLAKQQTRNTILSVKNSVILIGSGVIAIYTTL